MLSHMSQVAAKKRLLLEDGRVKVTAHFHEQGSVLKGTQTGKCDGFDIEVAIESEEAPDKIAELMSLAHQMCFTEDALAHEMKLTTTHLLNGKPIDQPTDGS